MSGYGLGIDVGTTCTAAAVARDGRVETVTLGTEIMTMPSAVFLTSDGTVLVGDAALRRGEADPTRVAREFKRRLGDPVPIIIGGTPISAQELTATLLRSVVQTVSDLEGGPPEAVAVTYPASWGPYKRELFVQAVRLAGLEGAVLVTEPEAAAVSYAAAKRVQVGDAVAVYDLGGGTFDAAVLRRTQTGFELLGRPEGIERLGGIDFDEAVLRHVYRSVPALAELDPEDPVNGPALLRLRLDCVRAKEALSVDTDVLIPVSVPGIHTSVRLTRSEFNEMIRPTLAPTIDATTKAITSAGMIPADLKSVLLSGGSSRIPVVAVTVDSGLNRPVAVDSHPKHSVALGAARLTTSRAEVSAPANPGFPDHAKTTGPRRAVVPPSPSTPPSPTAPSAPTPPTSRRPEVPASPPRSTAAPPTPPPRPPGVPASARHPPTHPAPETASQRTRRRHRLVPIASLLSAVVAVALLAWVAFGSGLFDGFGPGPVLAEGEILREPAAEPGPAPFSDSVADAGSPPIAGAAVPGSRPGSTTIVRGGRPGLFGGTRGARICDKTQLIAFLRDDPSKGSEWTATLGVGSDEIADYIARLTPVLLRADTRVTNHGYRDGSATPRQAVLQAGTAVLVDEFGQPRVRCDGGNPLQDPVAVSTSRQYRGDDWPAFDLGNIVVVGPADAPLAGFAVHDVRTGEQFLRPAGTSGEADTLVVVPQAVIQELVPPPGPDR